MKIYNGYFCECGPRECSEDYIAFRYMPEHDRSVFVLCDGMGSCGVGAEAARIVAESICDYWINHTDMKDCPQKFNDAYNEAKQACNDGLHTGMAVAIVSIEGNKATFAHCGGCRIYVVKNKAREVYCDNIKRSYVDEYKELCFQSTANQTSSLAFTEMEVQIGDEIMICCDGIYANGKSKALNAAVIEEYNCYQLWAIQNIAKQNPHESCSAILIRVCEDAIVTRAAGLFRVNRHPKELGTKAIDWEYFRTRREAHARLVELGSFSKEKDVYRYSCGRCLED